MGFAEEPICAGLQWVGGKAMPSLELCFFGARELSPWQGGKGSWAQALGMVGTSHATSLWLGAVSFQEGS